MIAGLVLVEGIVLALPGAFTGASLAALRAARLTGGDGFAPDLMTGVR